MEKIKNLFNAIEEFRKVDKRVDYYSKTDSFDVIGYTFRPMFMVMRSTHKDGTSHYSIKFNPGFSIRPHNGNKLPDWEWDEWFEEFDEYDRFINHGGFYTIEDMHYQFVGKMVSSIQLKGTLFPEYQVGQYHFMREKGLITEEHYNEFVKGLK